MVVGRGGRRWRRPWFGLLRVMGVVVGVPAVFVVAYYFNRKALTVNVYSQSLLTNLLLVMNAATVVDLFAKEQSLWLFHASRLFIAFSVDSEVSPNNNSVNIFFFQ